MNVCWRVLWLSCLTWGGSFQSMYLDIIIASFFNKFFYACFSSFIMKYTECMKKGMFDGYWTALIPCHFNDLYFAIRVIVFKLFYFFKQPKNKKMWGFLMHIQHILILQEKINWSLNQLILTTQITGKSKLGSFNKCFYFIFNRITISTLQKMI